MGTKPVSNLSLFGSSHRVTLHNMAVQQGQRDIPPKSPNLATAGCLAVIACLVGLLLAQDHATAHRHVSKHHAPRRSNVVIEVPRVVAVQGVVQSFTSGTGTLTLRHGSALYDVRVGLSTAFPASCRGPMPLAPGGSVLVKVAAYLDGPLQAQSIAPAASAMPAKCRHG
jgi:hypothetical protein